MQICQTWPNGLCEDEACAIFITSPQTSRPFGSSFGLDEDGLREQRALFVNVKKRADKLRAEGSEVDFDELLRMEPDGGTTNIRKTDSKHWTRWLGIENRCVVPVTRFAEPNPKSKVEGGRVPNAWFASTGSAMKLYSV